MKEMDKVRNDTSRRDCIRKDGFDKMWNRMVEMGVYYAHRVTPKV